MASRAVEPNTPLGAYRKLTFIAVALHCGTAQNFLHPYIHTADPAQGVFYPLALGLQLLLVGDMAEIASASSRIMGTIRFPPGRGTLQNLLHLGVSGIL